MILQKRTFKLVANENLLVNIFNHFLTIGGKQIQIN
jgi:hypothetical protein